MTGQHISHLYGKMQICSISKDTSRLDKLIRLASMKLDFLVKVAEKRTLDKLLDFMKNARRNNEAPAQ